MAAAQDVLFQGNERFDVRRRIGSGGMGVVYEAWDREHEKRVALKTLRHADARALYRFKNEFRSLQGLNHPNLVRLHELFSDGDAWFFSMEYIAGVDFLSWVRGERSRSAAEGSGPDSDARTEDLAIQQPPTIAMKPGKRKPAEAQTWTGRIADEVPGYDEARLRSALGQLGTAIHALHTNNKVHRDIKPNNILVTHEGRLVLADFGLVFDRDLNRASTAQSTVGTAIYMAPEQAIGRDVQPAVDWYSFGVVLYEALTGRLPYDGKTAVDVLMKKQQYEPAPPRSRVPGVPRDLDALCCELLRPDPDRRPGGVEIIERLGVDTKTDTSAGLLVSRSSRFTQSTPFVGRAEELAQLEKAYSDSRGGRAVTIVVRGASGIGKSVLVRQFIEQLKGQESDVVVLSGRCYERETVPYKAFDGIADSLSHFMMQLSRAEAASLLPIRAGLLPELFPVLRRVEAIAGAPRRLVSTMDPQLRRKQLFSAIRELFIRLTQRRPVVLFVDDFQWADADSLTLIDELLHPPDEPPLLLVATARTAEMADSVASNLEKLSGDLRLIELDVLPPDRAQLLVRRLTPRIDPRPEQVAAIASEAAGHPLFIFELVLYLGEEGARPEQRSFSLDEALWSRISRLSAAGQQLIAVLAVAGSPIAQETAANAASMSYPEYEKAASLLRVAYLARTSGARGSDHIETYHDRVREAVLANIDDDTRRNHHLRLAIALEQAGAGMADPQVLVRHFEHAGSAELAARHAEEAAQRASRVSAFEQASELYRTTIRLGQHDPRRRRSLLILLGEALANAGRGAQAAEAYEEASQGAEPAVQLDCQRHAAEQWLYSGYIARGLDALEQLLQQIGLKLPPTPRRALFNLLWFRLRLALRGFRWKEKLESQIAHEQLTRLDVYKAVSHGLGMVDNVRGAEFNARYTLLALKTGEVVRVGRAIATEAVHVAVQGGRGIPRGRRLAERVARLVERQDNPYLTWWSHLADAGVSYAEGRFRYTADVLREADDGFRERVVGAKWELNTTRLFRTYSLRHMGQWKEMRQLVQGWMRDAQRRGDRFLETTLRRYTSFLWLADDLPQHCLENLERASWIPPEGRFHLQHWFGLEARSELALYENRVAGDLKKLEPLFDAMTRSLLTRIQILRAIMNKARGNLYLAAAEETGDKSYLSRARSMVSKLTRERIGYATVFALPISAGIAWLSGDRNLAIEQLRAAVREGEKQDMLLGAAAARRRLGELIGGDTGARNIEQAESWMRSQEIKAPQRMCAVVAPGFARKPA